MTRVIWMERLQAAFAVFGLLSLISLLVGIVLGRRERP